MSLRLRSDECRVLFHWVVVYSQIGYSTVLIVQYSIIVITYDIGFIEPYNNTVGSYSVENIVFWNVMIL